MKYRVEVKKSVLKGLKKIPKEDQIRIAVEIQKLSDDPRPAYSTKLAGSEYYRVRCGDYRIIYSIHDEVLVICVLKVGHRKDVYR
jgi:mRNA interferase RelE/StbE